jgi:hypothetical protein
MENKNYHSQKNKKKKNRTHDGNPVFLSFKDPFYDLISRTAGALAGVIFSHLIKTLLKDP